MTRTIAVTLALLFTSCTTGNTRVDWPTVASCGRDVTSDAIGSVTRVLLEGPAECPATGCSIGDRAVSELEALARTHTPTVIACLVNELVTSWSQPGAAQHDNRVAATQRGRDFLHRVAGTSVIEREVEP